MSGIVPGTLVQMRVIRHYSHYNRGDVIAVPLEAGLELERKRLAEPILILVPPQVTAAASAEPALRQPSGGIVRK